MASYNKVLLMGNLTRDPELRYLPNGNAVVTLRLAVNRRWKTETGEEREEVTFVDVEAFRRQAEVLAQYLKKGNPLFVEGRLRMDQWEDKNTHQKRSQLKVVLESFTFIGAANRGEGHPPGAGAAPTHNGTVTRPAPAPAAAQAAPAMEEIPPHEGEDDVPF
ncbi:MAG: single-stranded DNA-binding protein [Verrucomicrobiota bacterium]